jgi:two-component system sensor histidine kinase ChvG
MRWRGRRAWRASRIGLRLLAFNVLVVFVPAAGVLYLDVYEDRLLEAQERSMVQQARLLAAIAGERPGLDADAAQAVLDSLGRRNDARMRIFDQHGAVVADSFRSPDRRQDEQPRPAYQSPPPDARGRVLYRVGAALARARARIVSAVRSWLSPEEDVTDAQAGAPDAELKAALAGRYGAATRKTPGQRSLTLFTAVPVRDGVTVTGAVVVSQSTFRILQALYDVRLRVFQVVVASLVAAALLTTIAATTIVRPLTRLRRAAALLAERRRPPPEGFPGTQRRDEIGDLARALEDLTRRLSAHIGLLEGLAADVSHEFKNPLAGIRSAAETIEQCDDPIERGRFVSLMLRDVGRLERLVSSLRDLARIDGQIEHGDASRLDLAALVRAVADGIVPRAPGVTIVINGPRRPCWIVGDGEALAQVFDNVLTNAVGFAPPATAIDLQVTEDADACVVTVDDRGPGIPDAHLERIFERFFSYRPAEGRREHLGLGLPIARRIVEAHGGTITAGNRPGGGARFEVRLRAR